MNAPPDQRSFLEELDARQDSVLEKLAELNQRVEALLSDCLANRSDASEIRRAEPAHGLAPQAVVILDDPGAPICQSPTSVVAQPGH